MLFRRIFIYNIFFIAVFNMAKAQPKYNYDAAWKKVDELVTKKGLTESALKEVQVIYNNAKKEKNDAQLIKALVFRVNLQQAKEEDADIKAIQQIEKEILVVDEPVKSILQNLLAEAYWQYLQNNRWKFYNRTNTIQFKKEDIATWTTDDFHQKITALYLASLKEEKLLQQISLEGFEPIIIKGNMRMLRPTLYDLLANRALDYFEHDERTITKPADAFEISTASVFAPATDFIKVKFATNDTTSLHHKALLLLQKLLAFHIDGKNNHALIDADIRRIDFVNRYATIDNKNELYRNALNHLLNQYNYQPMVAQAGYLLAKDYADFAATYDFTKHKTDDSSNPRWYYKKALELCNRFISQKENSEGRVHCGNLAIQIQQKNIELSIEKVNIPNQPFRSLVTYKNTARLWFRIIKINRDPNDEQELNNYWEEKYWTKITALAPVHHFDYNMPATDDYQQHKAEIKIPALPTGNYILLASAAEDFGTGKNILAARHFHVSNIAWIYNKDDFFILGRESGKPLVKATVQVWQQGYDYTKGRYTNVKAEQYSTDVNGYFKMKATNENNSYNRRLEVSFEKDRLFLDDHVYSYQWNTANEKDEIENRLVFLFTDRSIYRPGQTVYFKGIVTTKDASTGKPKVIKELKTKLVLYDANYQKVDTITVKTNEFGSYSGQFILPQGQLNGNFRITDETTRGEVYFSVEEYKRPKFFVEYLPVKGTYRVNDEIKVTGIAKAYAGNYIDNAKVTYRVVREPRILYPWLCWHWGWPQMNVQEIAHGETVTRADGTFDISFTAIPDKQVRKELDPVFDYKILADITDLNGETRTGETEISVSYKALVLEISLPAGETIVADSLKHINIRTTNLMGEYEKATVTVALHKIDAPKRLIRNRYWEQPDQFVIKQEDYQKDFPYDEYNNESNKENWKLLEKVFERTDSSSKDLKFRFTGNKFQPGWYKIEAVTKDKNGEAVKNIAFIQLIDGKTQQPISPAYIWNFPSSVSKEPGEKVAIEFGSSAADVFLIQQEDKDFSREPVYSFNTLTNEKKSLQTAVEEKNRGGFGYIFSFIKHNRFYTATRYVNVPWTNKDLKINYETFRNKTYPGSKEEWKIKITGSKGEKLAAELLTSMYDASLDQFKPHAWYKPSLFTINNLRNRWNKGGFLAIRSWQKNFEEREWLIFDKRYDELLDINFIGQNVPRLMKMSNPALDSKAAPVPTAAGNPQLNEVAVNGVDGKYRKSKEVKEEAERKEDNKQTSKKSQQTGEKSGDIQIRKNFAETAFFYPQLQTDSSGSILISFTMPEALTKWKWQILGHTSDLSTVISQKDVITQKDLMVQPFAPRFLREGDRFEFTAKITNLTDKEITGNSNLQLLNTATMQPVDGWFQNIFPNQHFTVAAGQSTVVKFRTEVPYGFNNALTYRITARAANQSDGEEATLPVLTNRMLVTETLPLAMRNTSSKNFSFVKLLTNKSESLTHHRFTVEFTSNPVWYAVQALPYIMEYPYECAEQTWNRFYANALASSITAKIPKIKAVFEQWKVKDSAALLSNLQKNEELKSILLQETPWVLQANNEEQQKKNIALLFDMLRMSRELDKAIGQLQQMQSSNGGFVWFKGGPDDRYITQYILTGIGHLKKLNAWPKSQEKKLNHIVAKAIPYLDRKLKEDYDYLIKNKVVLKNNNLGYSQIQYLYMRSFFTDIKQTTGTETVFNYYFKQSQQYWLQQSRYMQGMIALALHRNKDLKIPAAIVKSLKENAIVSEEMGMYWKEFNGGYYWYQAPVEAQAMMIEVFSDITKDETAVNDLKTWLLKQKQTQNWKTTIATAEACYALLLQGSDPATSGWGMEESFVEVKAGTQSFSAATEKTEAGTGYFKRSIDGAFVKPEMGNISVKVTRDKTKGIESKEQGPIWGAAYWQYFENLDRITAAETPLKLQKKYFVERNTSKGPVLTPVEDGTALKVGDKIKVRIELRVDRNMEYVHMKDMRPSCMEPVNVLSTYKWQGGLGYYESTKDASTNFFFGWLNRGTYVFEYPMFITHAGNYSSGITTIQCMYAPEFTSHSEGIRVKVVE